MVRKKPQAPPRPGKEYKLRLPQDVADMIEIRAKAEQRPQNRIIINMLASVPRLEKGRLFEDLIGDMEVVLARHGRRISWHDVQDELLAAVDELLKSEGGAAQAALERLRAVRTGMLIAQRSLKKE